MTPKEWDEALATLHHLVLPRSALIKICNETRGYPGIGRAMRKGCMTMTPGSRYAPNSANDPCRGNQSPVQLLLSKYQNKGSPKNYYFISLQCTCCKAKLLSRAEGLIGHLMKELGGGDDIELIEPWDPRGTADEAPQTRHRRRGTARGVEWWREQMLKLEPHGKHQWNVVLGTVVLGIVWRLPLDPDRAAPSVRGPVRVSASSLRRKVEMRASTSFTLVTGLPGAEHITSVQYASPEAALLAVRELVRRIA